MIIKYWLILGIWTLVTVVLLSTCTSCAQLIVRDENDIERVKINTFAKDIKLGDYEGISHKLKARTINGTVETKEDTE